MNIEEILHSEGIYYLLKGSRIYKPIKEFLTLSSAIAKRSPHFGYLVDPEVSYVTLINDPQTNKVRPIYPTEVSFYRRNKFIKIDFDNINHCPIHRKTKLEVKNGLYCPRCDLTFEFALTGVNGVNDG